MILYQLKCSRGHEFEAWFKSSAAYDAQARRKVIVCPVCGGKNIQKAIMAPRVGRSDRRSARHVQDGDSPAADAAPTRTTSATLVSPEQRRILAEMRELRNKLLANSEYVGPRFAEEARRIHDREAPERGIYGEATTGEVQALHEDGIEVFPIPVLPDDKN